MKNFELTSETKVNIFGVTLFRIKALVSFSNVSEGEVGGWVEKDANVSGNAWVYGNAEVSGDARVYGNAEVSGDARVYGNAWVYGDAWTESPLQIQGTRHFINVCKKGFLKIGCMEFSFKKWKEIFKETGNSQGYTEKQIEEYRLYIELAIALYPEDINE